MKKPLAAKECVPCKGGVAPLKDAEIQPLLKELGNEWTIEENKLKKEYRFPDFKQALYFVNHIGQIAEREGHHPDVHLAWGRVTLLIWTHKIKGLTESDFILAAKCDEEMTEEILKKSLF